MVWRPRWVVGLTPVKSTETWLVLQGLPSANEEGWLRVNETTRDPPLHPKGLIHPGEDGGLVVRNDAALSSRALPPWRTVSRGGEER